MGKGKVCCLSGTVITDRAGIQPSSSPSPWFSALTM